MSDNNLSLLVDDLNDMEFESSDIYQILFLEDNADDVELMEHELHESGMQFTSRRVDNKDKFIKEVIDFSPDIILADYSLTAFNGMEAFRKLKSENLTVPFILVTGVLSEKLALDCLKEGVDDFILKSSFKRLPAAVISAIRKKEMQEEKKRIALELKKSHEELRLLVNRHQISIEEERMNIARDLHDELGQVLTALKIDIAMLRKKLTSGKPMSEQAIQDEFASINKTIDKITTSAKEISAGLRPETLDDLGILDAIQWQATEFEKRNQITCQLFLSTDHLDITKELSIALFRIVQEALTNVARHSGATAVQIYLDSLDNVLFLEILDNGKGIEDEKIKSSKSLGIIGLRERVQLLHGNFFIGKAKGGGTKVSIMIPITKTQNR